MFASVTPLARARLPRGRIHSSFPWILLLLRLAFTVLVEALFLVAGIRGGPPRAAAWVGLVKLGPSSWAACGMAPHADRLEGQQ